MILDIFENLDSYSRAFMDPVLWDPYLRLICAKHHFCPVEVIRPGLAGTYPTFIVDERRVIKLFGRLFNGAESWAVERLCAELVEAAQHFPTARLLGWGALFEGDNWNWPYLIFEYIPGISLGEAAQNISYTERERLASWLGESVRTLHDIPINNEALSILPRQKNLLGNTRMNPSQRHQSWKKVPANWLDQIEDYLTSTDYLEHNTWPEHLIHADLTRDHLLGYISNGHWHTNAIIDFGDAILGSLDYELVTLHLDLFQGDTHLLKIFLDGYGLGVEDYPTLLIRSMRATLLHPYNLLDCLPSNLSPSHFSDLKSLLSTLWEIPVE